MKVQYQKKFLKELARIPSKHRIPIEKFVFKELPEIENLIKLNKLEKMKGHRAYFKVRFGSFRVGLKVESDSVILERVLHRKDIYRYFP